MELIKNLNEDKVLEKIFWPKEKSNFSGLLVYTNYSEDLLYTEELKVTRSEHELEINFFKDSIVGDNLKTLVKLNLIKKEEGLFLNSTNSSKEIKTESDVENVLLDLNNIIKMMNVEPAFFPTNVITMKKKKII